MRTFQLSPPIRAWYDQLVDIGVNGRDVPAPAQPASPTNFEELAFFNTVLVPLAQEITASYAARNRIWRVSPDPYALDPYTGQPLYPESWGTQSGSP